MGNKRRDREIQETAKQFDTQPPDAPPIPRSNEPIEAKTPNQKRYISAIKHKKLTFGVGPAGTGKSWIACALAAEALYNKSIEQIIITRPAVEAGESLGFLPGELEEKFSPYLWPMRDVLVSRLGSSFFEYCLKSGKIEVWPLAYMRGRTFRRAFVILDEAQNTTPSQMKMFLTRIGDDSRIVVNGDTEQKDIHGDSGLTDAIARVSYIPEVSVVEFGNGDIVRSGLCAEIVQAYRPLDPLLRRS